MTEFDRILALTNAEVSAVRGWVAFVRQALNNADGIVRRYSMTPHAIRKRQWDLRRRGMPKHRNTAWAYAGACVHGHRRHVYRRPGGKIECRTCLNARMRAYRRRHAAKLQGLLQAS